MLSVSKVTMSRWNRGGIEVGEGTGTVLFCFSVYLKEIFSSKIQNVRSILFSKNKIPRLYSEGALNFLGHRVLG